MNHEGFTSAREALDFIGGGNAVFTIKSTKTGKHFTFKASVPKDKKTGKKDPIGNPTRFVRVLSHGRNTSWEDTKFVGFFVTNMPGWLKCSSFNDTSGTPSFKALAWALAKMNEARVGDDEMPEGLEVFHEGACCRCNRPLTDPASIKRGIGPECATKGGF